MQLAQTLSKVIVSLNNLHFQKSKMEDLLPNDFSMK